MTRHEQYKMCHNNHYHHNTTNVDASIHPSNKIELKMRSLVLATSRPLAVHRNRSAAQRCWLSMSSKGKCGHDLEESDPKILNGAAHKNQHRRLLPSILVNAHCHQPQTIHSLLTQTTLRHLSSSKRRRRAGSGTTPQTDSSEDDRSSANAPSPSSIVKDEDIFLGTSRAYLDKVEEAVEPMKAKNDVFKVTRSSNESGENLTITLKPGEGQYIFQVDVEMKTMTMNSPMSGTYTYVCRYTDDFVGMIDGHLCEGMLVRDLIRHCYGLPKF